MQTIQNTQPPHTEAYEPDDEINLLDLLLVPLKHKKLIFWSVFIVGVFAVAISIRMPDIYRSEATIALRSEDSTSSIDGLSGIGGLGGMVAGRFGFGGNEGLQKLKITLDSRELARRVIQRYKLMPMLFSYAWDLDKKEWREKERKPTIQDAWNLILNNLLKITVNQDTDTIDVGFEHNNRELAKNVVEFYISELSETLREEVLLDAIEKKKFFNQQLQTTSDSLLREKIYSLLAKEIEKETFAKAQDYYGFILIDPPIIPDLNRKISPNRFLIVFMSVFIAFFFSIFLSFAIEFKKRMEIEYPDRYNSVVNELLFRKARG